MRDGYPYSIHTPCVETSHLGIDPTSQHTGHSEVVIARHKQNSYTTVTNLNECSDDVLKNWLHVPGKHPAIVKDIAQQPQLICIERA